MSRLIFAILLFTFLPALTHAEAPAKLDAVLEKSTDGKTRIAVRGLDQARLAACAKGTTDWESLARVQVASGTATEIGQRPALLGTWSVADAKLIFTPRFPLGDGVSLRVSLDRFRLVDEALKPGVMLLLHLETPRKDLTPVTEVERVFPTRNKLPENQLRFYIHFSGSMSRGDAYSNIKLLDAKGKVIEDVFLELEEELWDPTQTRFTLLFDPGRIKRGLKPREDLGPSLEEGKSHTLVISGNWRDAEGRKLLTKELRKEFTAGPPDNEPIDPKKWKLVAPNAATKNAFQVRFPESLDHGLLHRVVSVVDEKGKKIAGKVNVSEEETLWQFTPDQPWVAGSYRLLADSILEDLAA
ncbi:MAG: hypothetical protein K8T89_19040, partial [Planctomycetes bacterium]|nr:hypothetical protein [Planctomycetota bacterium]